MALAERNPTSLRRISIVIGIWLVAAVTVLGLARMTAFGPVVLTMSNRHGVHLGDLAALMLVVIAASALTGRYWHAAESPDRAQPTRPILRSTRRIGPPAGRNPAQPTTPQAPQSAPSR